MKNSATVSQIPAQRYLVVKDGTCILSSVWDSLFLTFHVYLFVVQGPILCLMNSPHTVCQTFDSFVARTYDPKSPGLCNFLWFITIKLKTGLSLEFVIAIHRKKIVLPFQRMDGTVIKCVRRVQQAIHQNPQRQHGHQIFQQNLQQLHCQHIHLSSQIRPQMLQMCCLCSHVG